MKKTYCSLSLAVLLFLLVRILGSAVSHPLAEAGVSLLSLLFAAAPLYAVGDLPRATSLLSLPKRKDLPALALIPLFIFLTLLLSIPSAYLADLLGLNRTVAPSGSIGLLLVTGALIPAAVEELLARSLLLGPLGADRAHAVWLSSLLFAVLHLNLAQLPYALVSGLLLGALASVSGSVLFPILFHLANNAASLLLGCFGAQLLPTLLILLALGLLPLLLPAPRRIAAELLLRIAPDRNERRAAVSALLSPLALPILICLLLSLL